MATKKLNDLQKVMELMGEAFYFDTPVAAADIATASDILEKAAFEMPIGEEGVTFEVGDPDITRKRITEGRTWISFAKRSDDNITFQVPSFDNSINELFLVKAVGEKGIKVGADTYKGQGYSLKPKKVVGSWLFLNPEHTIAVLLPVVEAYGTLKGAQGDNEGYYNVSLVPLADADNAEVYIFHKESAATD